MGPWRTQYDHKQQCCEKGGHDENNMTINNNVVKKGTWRKQYEHKQQGCEKKGGGMMKTIWP
jgi:hypothetical protein